MRISAMIFLVIILFSCKTEKRNTLNIAVAANAQYAMEEIHQVFENAYQIETEMVVSASGTLTAQIEQGAPYDVLLSANLKYPEYLDEHGLSVGPPEVYALGTLVLWSAKEVSNMSLEMLLQPNIKHIAIPNPQNAPYGEAATQALINAGIYEAVKNKLVFGESVGQTTQFIASGAADVGFTALSVLKSPQLKAIGSKQVIPNALHSPISQGMVLIDHGNPQILENAHLFKTFLFSAEGQEILHKWGYQ